MTSLTRICMATSGIVALGLCLYFLTLSNGFDFAGFKVGRDFVNMYHGGQLIAAGDQDILFDASAYHQSLTNWIGTDYSIHYWSYPPTMFWVAEVLSRLPYALAYFLWHAGGVALLLLAVRATGLNWIWGLLICFSPAGAWNIFAGQNGFYLCAFLALAIFSMQAKTPFRAGLAWAAATVKPHLGALALPMLIASRQYRTLLFGGGIFLLILAATVYRYGTAPWISFFKVTAPQQRAVAETWDGILLYMMPTGFIQGRLWGLSTFPAYSLHAIYMAITIVLLVRAWSPCRNSARGLFSWFVLGTGLILPYLFLYDLIMFQLMLALWHREPERLFGFTNPDLARTLWLLAWLSPFLGFAIVIIVNTHILPFMFMWILWRLGRQT